MAKPEEVARHLHMCNSCFYQVSESWPMQFCRVLLSTAADTDVDDSTRIKLRDITRTDLYNFDPLKPHFYIVKLGFTGGGVYIILLISALKHRLWVFVRTASPRQF